MKKDFVNKISQLAHVTTPNFYWGRVEGGPRGVEEMGAQDARGSHFHARDRLL